MLHLLCLCLPLFGANRVGTVRVSLFAQRDAWQPPDRIASRAGAARAGSSSDLESTLGLNAGTRTTIGATAAKMDKARDWMVKAPGSAIDSDSDSDSSSDGGAAPMPQRAAAACVPDYSIAPRATRLPLPTRLAGHC